MKKINMIRKIGGVVIMLSMLVGCASVPTEQPEIANALSQVIVPTEGNAGLYIYRSPSLLGAALKKDIWVDEECIGETARGIFFYTEVEGGMDHKVSTESEFSPNDLMITTEAGKNYFIQQYMRLGMFVAGAGLKQQPEDVGKQSISELALGIQGNCSRAYPTKKRS